MSCNFDGERIRPKVLVLLAACNGAEFIVEQVNTVLDQVGVDIRLVISDDGSEDDTLSRVSVFTGDPRVLVVSPPTPTGSASRNYMWMIGNTEAIGSDFVALCDQDDIWANTKLFRGCCQLRSSRADGYSCTVTTSWPNGRLVDFRQCPISTKSDFLFEGAGQGCTYILSVEFYLRVRDFVLKHRVAAEAVHYHDWAIYALSRCWGLTWIFDAASLMTYRQHAANDTGARLSLAGVRKRLRLIRGGWYSTEISRILAICAIANPVEPSVSDLSKILRMRNGLKKRFRLAKFCVSGGRRRFIDRWLLTAAVVLGWIGET